VKSLAIIPARSGSKGVKHKNIKLLNGKPLLAYSIEAAIDSGLFTEIMVSTDSDEYAEIAKSYGAKVPFLRSDNNSTDSASSWDMVMEVLQNYKKMNCTFDNVCLLQPTSPLREASDIKNAYELFYDKDANSVISVCEMEHSPIVCMQVNDDCSMGEFVLNGKPGTNRQSVGKYYRINGAIYIVKTNILNNIQNLYTDRCFTYIMDEKKSIDIDTEFDFFVTEKIINSSQK